MRSITEIDMLINKLHDEKKETIKKLEQERKEELLRLEWLKDVKLSFYSNTIGAYGHPEYILTGYIPEKYVEFGGTHKYYTIKEKHPDGIYYMNLNLSFGNFSEVSNNQFFIKTCSPELMSDFIEENNVKVGELPSKFNNVLNLYKVIQSHAKSN